MKANIVRNDLDETIQNFIQRQLRPNKVLNSALLNAFATVNRVDFLPVKYQSLAYIDANLPAEQSRLFLSPLVLARLINLVEIKPTDRCLIIGGLTGYSAAVLSSLSTTVCVVEQEPACYKILSNNATENQSIHQGRLEDGWPESTLFDWILIEGGVEIIPQKIVDQLSEGGSLVTVYNKNYLMGSGCIWQKNIDIVTLNKIFDTYVPPLTGFKLKKTFSL
jgi:protein-L-isoaspartate(D-aspartate) O-methyltransferase